ncbi:HNH endonuclease [bacterium]|nr:HNH endonuclease [bacterium]
MRVSGVNIFAYNNCKAEKPVITSVYSNPFISVPIIGHDTFEHSPSFTANPIHTHGQFRFLTKEHDIHCFYCKKLMLYGGTLQELLESGVFSGPIKDFVEAVRPYRKRMKKGQRTVFDQIERYSKKSPQTHLSEIIQYLYQNSIRRLVKTQSGILKDLNEQSKALPSEDMRTSFRKFMRKQHKRLYEIPDYEEFNAEKFSYKIDKMIQSIPNDELKAYLTKITTPMAEPEFLERNTIIPYELASQMTKSKLGKLHTAEEFSEYVIMRVQKIAERLGRQDMVRLCETSKDMIHNKKVTIPFSNKEFMLELVKEQLAGIKKTPLYYEMMHTANKLPNSTSSKNSFVVKHRYSDSDTIGYKLLEPAIATVEHVKARSDGGVDDLTNIVLACKADNNERGSMPQYLYMERWNKRNPQIYFNDIMKISKEEQLITPSDIEGMARSVLNEGKVKVDTSGLKK